MEKQAAVCGGTIHQWLCKPRVGHESAYRRREDSRIRWLSQQEPVEKCSQLRLDRGWEGAVIGMVDRFEAHVVLHSERLEHLLSSQHATERRLRTQPIEERVLCS